MTLPARLNEAPTPELAPHYKKIEENGKSYYLADITPVDGFGLENVAGLKSALGTERERATNFERMVKGFGDYTPEKIRSLSEELSTLKGANKDVDSQVEARLKTAVSDIEKKYNGEKERMTVRETALLTNLRDAMIVQQARAELAQHALDKEAVQVLLPHALEELDLREEDGRFNVVVRGKDGTPRISQKMGDNSRMTVTEYVADVMRNDARFKRLFKGTSSSGGGTPPNETDAGRVGGVIQISETDAKDVGKYRAARDLATKEKKRLQIVAG